MSYDKPKLAPTRIWLAAILMASFILAYLPVWKSLVGTWLTSDEYSHGFFVIPLSLYIVWRKKPKLVETTVIPSRWGLAFVIFSLLLYLFARFAEIATVASFSMVALIAAVIVYLCGFAILREIAFPLMFLLFMIPVPAQIYSALTVPLQLFVTKASVWIAAHLTIPVYREGNVIHLPGQTLEVVRACSGLRSMISLLTLSAILGYFTLTSNFLRLILFFSGIPAAIAVNVIRVLVLMITFHYFTLDLTSGTTHTVFGLFIFILALIFILAIKGVLSNWDTHSIAK